MASLRGSALLVAITLVRVGVDGPDHLAVGVGNDHHAVGVEAPSLVGHLTVRGVKRPPENYSPVSG